MSLYLKELERNFREFERISLPKEEIDKINSFGENYEESYKYLAEKYLLWDEPFKTVMTGDETSGYTFFKGGTLCPLKNILRKHLTTAKKNKAALIWIGADGMQRVYTYQSLFSDVVKTSAALRKLGVKQGDRVLLHMPNMPELVIFMLACTKLGAVHVVYHASYSSESLAERINDCKPCIIVTTDESITGGYIKMKEKLDNALSKATFEPKYCVVVERTRKRVHMKPLRDLWYHDLISDEKHSNANTLPYEPHNADDTMFMLYTSTNMAEPKALTYSYAGYLLWAYVSYLMLFDMKETDTFWCTADISWITGHSYLVYGPLMAGQTVLIHEDSIDSDNAAKFYEICDKFSVNKLYTTPAMLRSLMNAAQKKKIFSDIKTLELIATGGEKLPEEILEWASAKLCKNKAAFIDIYSLTEAGGAIFAALPGYGKLEYGTVSERLPSVPAVLFDKTTKNFISDNDKQGEIVLKSPFPALCTGIHNQPGTFEKIYWKQVDDSYYFSTGDGGKLNENGFMVLTGRLDDVLHIGGKRISLVQIEEAIKKYEKVKECAVININDEKRGEKLIAFCVLHKQLDESYYDQTVREIRETILDEIGEVALPGEIRFSRTIPKSPDGAILRDLLKEIAMQM
ncbi:AMP-dependent synthetase and ligase [Denitrovibrio acetiphilus DSM 12809]|uniref:acetate--CoA ligase n=1 Tax=Denitrovibrio acetiphilus (strain DSM 12809 / NBRC 114555 / N2460) TaxID=522772 RepID=D4H7M0_DENA2|nr:AMP-binding protein [Denitrovibrio acetiphilus]ADD68019.1 AMP-dependent synthetase and ligase [Denitrovibrio acetiphilus DSM 12809]